MPARLSDLYQAGDRVEVRFERSERSERDDLATWRAARVLGVQPPGLWVQTADGAAWFVTNGRRIRAAGAPEEDVC
jgi:hypothetical protein